MAPGICGLLERAINRYLQLDPEGKQAFSELEGKAVAVELRGFELTLYLLPGADGIRVLDQYDGAPDTWLRGTPLALTRLGAMASPNGGMPGNEVEIRGDVETGKRFKELLENVNVDWEEPLSRLTGDVIAHQAGNFLRGTAGWLSQSLSALRGNLAEYVTEEARVLPAGIELENFYADVDDLHMAADRLEARINRLAHRLRPALDDEGE